MTRLERKEVELQKLYEYRRIALGRNDLMWLQRNQAKIDALEKEIEECKSFESKRLSDALSEEDNDSKMEIFKLLLRVHLLADATYAATCEVRDAMKAKGIEDFKFRQKVKDLSDLAMSVSAIAFSSNNQLIEDVIVDDDKFVELCIKHADAHLKRKLKL